MMKSLTDYQPNQAFGLLLIGEPKAGKSSLACQFPDCYVLDVDNNIGGAKRRLQELNKLSNVIGYDVLKLNDDGSPVDDKKCWKRALELLTKAINDPKVKTVIVDSLTYLCDYLQFHIMEEQKVTQMRIQDWQPFLWALRKLVVQMRSAGKLIIFTCHVQTEKDETDGIFKTFLAIPGKSKDTLGGLFSDVWLMTCKKEGAGSSERYPYMVRCMPNTKVSLGNSLGLPPEFEADYDKFIKPKLEALGK